MPDNIYPDFTNSRFDMRYAPRTVLPSDLLKGNVATLVSTTRVLERTTEGDTGETANIQIVRTLVEDNFIANPSHSYLACDASLNPIDLNFPRASLCRDKIIRIKKIDNTENPVTIIPSIGEQVDDENTYVMNVPKEGVALISNGVNWEIIT